MVKTFNEIIWNVSDYEILDNLQGLCHSNIVLTRHVVIKKILNNNKFVRKLRCFFVEPQQIIYGESQNV